MRFRVIQSLIPSICLCTIFTCSSVTNAEPLRDAQNRLGSPASGQRNFIGVKNQNCSNCHANSGPKNEYALPPDLRSAINDGWILGDELLTWSKQDHHYNAFAILQNELSQQMARQLGIVDPQSGKSLVHQDRRCLACHSSVPWDQMVPLVPLEQVEIRGELIKEPTTNDPRYTIGVACEACHGPAGKDKAGSLGWGSAHATPGDDSTSEKSGWRLLSAEDKFTKFGYWDVRSPETQARVCLSCHLGNVEQKKFITHEMYAAGHPPLPSFELSQFIRQMPTHWRRFEEKPEDVRVAYVKGRHKLKDPDVNNELEPVPQELAITRASMISSFVVLEESMRLTADLLDETSPTRKNPELANYACFACHHELFRDGWRKSRRLTSPRGFLTLHPGRPTLHEWPMILATIVEETIQQKTLVSNSKAVTEALNSHPFGKKDELIKAARELADASLKCTQLLSTQKIDKAHAHRFLKELASFGAKTDVDYDSARQLVWAYERTLAQLNDLKLNDERAATELKGATIEGPFGQNVTLLEFEQTLILWLRKNRNEATPVNLPPQGEPFSRTQRDINIPEELIKIAKYEPAVIREIFDRLLKQLEQEHLPAE